MGVEFASAAAPCERPAAIPPGPQLAAFLADHESLDRLDDAELIEMMAASRRQTAWSQARELAAIAELTARRDTEGERQPDHRVLSAGESLIEEIAAALAITGNAAATLMHTARRLASALPGTRTALEQGRIDLLKARVICDATDGMPDATTAQIETALLAHASHRTTGQLRRRAKTLARRLAPELCEELADKATRQRRVEVWDNATGTAALAVLDIAPEDAHAIHNKLTAAASAIRTDGDPRKLDQLRADLATQLLRGHPLPDAVTTLLTTPPDPASIAPGHPGPPDSAPLRQPKHQNGTDQNGTDQNRDPNEDRDSDQDQGEGRGSGRERGRGPGRDRARERVAAAIITELREASTPGRRTCHPITGPISSTQTRAGRLLPSPESPLFLHRPTDRQRGDPAPTLTPIASIHRPRTRPSPTLSLMDALATETHVRLAELRARLRATGHLADLPELAAQTVRRLHQSLTPYRDTWCETDEQGHHGHPGYRPPTALRQAIGARHTTCVFPTCNRHIQHCDLDHTIAYNAHGPTCGCNLAPLCRRHHRTKQTPGWSLFQPWPGLLIWITPAGTWHIIQPE